MEHIYRVDAQSGKLSLSLHSAQSQVWRSNRRFVFFIAGTQSGKTSLGPWWLWREIERCGAGDYLAVTSSYDLFKLKMLPALRECFEEVMNVGRYWSGDRVIELKNPATGRFAAERADDPMWGRIILRSAQTSTGLESATAKGAWLDECGQDEFGLDSWEAVLRRLSLAQGRVLGTTTPYNLGWLYTEVYQRWVKRDPSYHVTQARSTVNPAFPLAEFLRAQGTMAEWKFRMFYQGLFERPENLIYSAFNLTRHVVDPFEVPKNWPRYVGVDFGAINTALVWLAENPASGEFFAYRESLDGNRTTAEHAAAALQTAHGENVVIWTGGSDSEKQERWDWRSHGVHVRPPVVWSVEAGIDRVIELLKQDRLRVMRHCRGLIDEFGSYRRKQDQTGETTEEIKDKRKFHRLDALRYVAQVLPAFVRYAASAYPEKQS